MSAVKTYACLVDLIADVVKETKRKADIADAVEKALAEVGEFVLRGTGFTVFLDDAPGSPSGRERLLPRAVVARRP